MKTINPYTDSIRLENDDLRLAVAPHLGASVLSFDRIDGDGDVEIFRRSPDSIENAVECAMPVMLPWVNRISSGGIIVGDEMHSLEPNIPGEPFPNHGNGFQSKWNVLKRSPTSTTLELHSSGPGPYIYEAQYDLRLDDMSVHARIELVNRSTKILPFGIGLHPWLPRTPRTTLEAYARDVWLEDERYIPTRSIALDDAPEFDFRLGSCLPEGWINNSFVGWKGVAEIVWPERQLRLSISSPDATCYHVFSPGRHAGFFCFETETHIPDAARLLQAGTAGAPKWLQPGESIVHEARFKVANWSGAKPLRT